MITESYLRDNVPLPEDLTGNNIYEALKRTVDFFQDIRERGGIILSDIIQANNFSGLVSNVFTHKLNEVSVYKRYDDQRYPDLMHLTKNIGLEVKASNKPMKGGEGHNGHSGWHIVVCYNIDDNHDIDFSQVEIAQLNGFECGEISDWKYCGSHRNENHSQRTETYMTTSIGTAKLRDGTIYLNSQLVQISSQRIQNRQKIAAELPVPDYSPFKII